MEIDEKKDIKNYDKKLAYILGYPYGKDYTFSFGKMEVREKKNIKYISHKCSSSFGS